MTDYNKLPGLTTALKEILELVQENTHLKGLVEEYEMYNPYKRGKLYIIRNPIDDKVYVGATYQELHERMKEHRKDSKNPTRQSKLYVHMRKLGRDNFEISLLKLAPCKSKWHLENEEYAEQVKIPEDQRLFTPRKRLPIGLTPEEKRNLYKRSNPRTRQSFASLLTAFSSLVLVPGDKPGS